MKKFLLPTLLTAVLLGCSSDPSIDSSTRLVTNMTGGQSLGDSVSYFWYTEQYNFPLSAADFVTSGDYGWYKSDYRWRRDGVIREVVREGEQLKLNKGLIPFKLHLRFNDKGEAVYQQYRVDGKVLPIPQEDIAFVINNADTLRETVLEQNSNGQKLVQGYWDGKVFTTCSGKEYARFEINQALPNFVINRLASLDSYAAFLAATTPSTLIVIDMYNLADDSFDCVERPNLIKD